MADKDMITEEEYAEWQKRQERRFWIIIKTIIWIVVLSPGIWLLLTHYQHGDLKIYLDHDAYTKYEDEKYTRIYATRYTWWGLGKDKIYQIKAINGKWHIRESGKPNAKWTLMYFDDLGMDIDYVSEPPYPR